MKSRKSAGIIITKEIRGKRRARISGAGLEVWEIIESYLNLKKNFSHLSKEYHWLTQQQLKAAIDYYQAYPEEIDFLIHRNQSWTQEKIQKVYPFLPA